VRLSARDCRRGDRQGTQAVPEGAETCRRMREDAETGFLRVSRDFGSLRRVPTHSRTTMVRKGSPIRVRQRASETPLQRGFLVSRAARMTTSYRFLARRGQAWPLIGAAPCAFASRQRRVLNRRYPRGTRPAGTTVLAARFAHRGRPSRPRLVLSVMRADVNVGRGRRVATRPRGLRPRAARPATGRPRLLTSGPLLGRQIGGHGGANYLSVEGQGRSSSEAATSSRCERGGGTGASGRGGRISATAGIEYRRDIASAPARARRRCPSRPG
jgi:hypothetical protein